MSGNQVIAIIEASAVAVDIKSNGFFIAQSLLRLMASRHNAARPLEMTVV
jgi:hypothetical protein